MQESNVQRAAWLAVGAIGSRFKSAVRTVLFRVNTGKGWIGKAERRTDGSVIIHGGRPVALGFGLANGDPVVGAADLNGWTSIVVTPEMVGTRAAIFTSIECKRTTGGRTSKDQENWIETVRAAGGIAGVANTPAIAQSIVSDYCEARSIT
jgi:hypothetical protein